MAATGNAVANSYWEAKLSANQKPHYESSDLEPFIRRKYCNKEFAEGTWPPALPDKATPASTASGAPPQLASDTSAGWLEAGGFWGSLTPHESSVAADLLSDTPPGISLTSVTADSPALLIDLMDFGAESTFQLPTTPRRRGPQPPGVSGFGTAGSGSMPSVALPGVSSSSSSRGVVGGSTAQGGVPSRDDGRHQGVGSVVVAAAHAAAPGVQKQQPSSFPLLRPPPQVQVLLAAVALVYALLLQGGALQRNRQLCQHLYQRLMLYCSYVGVLCRASIQGVPTTIWRWQGLHTSCTHHHMEVAHM